VRRPNTAFVTIRSPHTPLTADFVTLRNLTTTVMTLRSVTMSGLGCARFVMFSNIPPTEIEKRP
jgi:hypothetical protein